MLPPTDYVRAARYLIERNGHKAQMRAESRAEALRMEGNGIGHAIWTLLAATVAELAGTARKADPEQNFFNRPSAST